MVIRIFALIVLFFFSAYKLNNFIESDEYKNINEKSKLITKLKNADVIFVNDKTYIPDKSFDIDNLGYRNSGICLLANDKTYVFFIENFGEKSILKAQEIQEFIKNSNKIAVYEFKKETDSKELLNKLNLYRNIDKKIYATEFLNEIFFKIHNKNIYTSKINVNKEDIITLQSIVNNENIKKRYEINF